MDLFRGNAYTVEKLDNKIGKTSARMACKNEMSMLGHVHYRCDKSDISYHWHANFSTLYSSLASVQRETLLTQIEFLIASNINLVRA